MKVLCFVALANTAPLDELADSTIVLRHEKRNSEPMERLLNLAHAMGLL
jgi:hypothetical protein